MLAQRYLGTGHLELVGCLLRPLVAMKGLPVSRLVDALKASLFRPDNSLSVLQLL